MFVRYAAVFHLIFTCTASSNNVITSPRCAFWSQVMLWVTELTLVTGSNSLFVCLFLSICSSVVRHAEDLPEGGLWQWGGHSQVSPWHKHLRPGGSVREFCTFEGSLPAAPFVTWTTRTSAQRHLPLAQRSPGQYDPISCVWWCGSRVGYQMSVISFIPMEYDNMLTVMHACRQPA
jgi:hypothetical protein